VYANKTVLIVGAAVCFQLFRISSSLIPLSTLRPAAEKFREILAHKPERFINLSEYVHLLYPSPGLTDILLA
jgi:hypothetical protein